MVKIVQARKEDRKAIDTFFIEQPERSIVFIHGAAGFHFICKFLESVQQEISRKPYYLIIVALTTSQWLYQG